MKIVFKKSDFQGIEEFVKDYKRQLSNPIDSFLEEHILSSQHFIIELEDKEIGYTSIFQGELITQFYLINEYRSCAQEVYNRVKRLLNVRGAFVPTCDEFFLAHSMDSLSSIERQAYFFKDSGKMLKGKRYNVNLRLAEERDIDEIKRLSGDFFDKFQERIGREEIYIASNDGGVVGYGIMERGIILKEYVSIGMFTVEEYRERGIGTAILIQLKNQVYKIGKKPLAGCWFYNHNSKKTLEKAGMISNTRLLKIFY